MCKIFGVSRSGYYAYLKRKDVPDRDLPLADKIRECQKSNHKTSAINSTQKEIPLLQSMSTQIPEFT